MTSAKTNSSEPSSGRLKILAQGPCCAKATSCGAKDHFLICLINSDTCHLEAKSVMFYRLLHDISNVDRALSFWAARLKAGQHRSFLLLGQGPTSFVLDILAVITRKPERKSHLSATDQIERRVSPSALREPGKLC